jgi:hypothetical protein
MLGTLDVAVVAATIATGATVKEVGEANAWLTADDCLAGN